jgi:hypothetical protein
LPVEPRSGLRRVECLAGQRIGGVVNDGQALRSVTPGRTAADLHVKAEPDQDPVHVGQVSTAASLSRWTGPRTPPSGSSRRCGATTAG